MTATSSGRNKRKSDRVRISSSRHLWNLSEGGAYLITDQPKRLGAIFHFEYKLGKNGPVFKALAKTIRVLHKPNPKTGEPAGMAIQFIQISPEDQESLRQYLQSLKGQRPSESEDSSLPPELLQVPEID